ncbi:MAG: DUF3298 and DUF4163 domain-containing protein [Tannerellaceae bacterium]|nr:DUF3298 and DUF4163 domain-containing protein [Tannerellaceae bacterium]
MNTKSYIFSSFILLFIGLAGLTGCQNKTTGKTGQGRINDIKFDSLQVDKESYLFNNTNNPYCHLQINFLYPVSTNPPAILDAVSQHFIITTFGEQITGLSPQEAVERFTKEYLDEYHGMEEYFQEDLQHNDDPEAIGNWYNYVELRYNEIYYNRNNILSYSTYREGFTGGAHGFHLLHNYVLDLTTGQQVRESDIFIEGYEGELAEILVKHITKENGVSRPEELEELGYFSIDEIYPNNNFLADEEGLIYNFNEYEIAPYSVGSTNVQISYPEIRHLLKPDSPVSKLTIDN